MSSPNNIFCRRKTQELSIGEKTSVAIGRKQAEQIAEDSSQASVSIRQGCGMPKTKPVTHLST